MSTPQQSNIRVNVRPATPDDAQTIYELIYALAEYEHLTHEVETTPQKVCEQLFGEDPAAQALVAEVIDTSAPDQAPKAVGTAIFFRNFSTFVCKPGLYLEDLFVLPEWRGYGVGKALITRLAGIAVERGYSRFDWCVLDWNQPAIDFYEVLGATVFKEWRICRVTGDALKALAQKSK